MSSPPIDPRAHVPGAVTPRQAGASVTAMDDRQRRRHLLEAIQNPHRDPALLRELLETRFIYVASGVDGRGTPLPSAVVRANGAVLVPVFSDADAAVRVHGRSVQLGTATARELFSWMPEAAFVLDPTDRCASNADPVPLQRRDPGAGG